MKEIISTNGRKIMVDDEMYEELSQHRWHVTEGRVVREVWENRKRVKRIFLHRVVARAKFRNIVRHKDGNKLNNQSENLEILQREGGSTERTPRLSGIRNHYEINGDTTTIYLKRKDGTVLKTIIDTDDLEPITKITGTWVAQWNQFTKGFYVVMNAGPAKYRERLSLHRVIAQPSEDQVVDHINRDTLDNRKSNLRNVSEWGNSQNTKKENKHGAKGVRWNGKDKLYGVFIRYRGKEHYLGAYKDRETAVIVSKASRKLISDIEKIS